MYSRRCTRKCIQGGIVSEHPSYLNLIYLDKTLDFELAVIKMRFLGLGKRDEYFSMWERCGLLLESVLWQVVVSPNGHILYYMSYIVLYYNALHCDEMRYYIILCYTVM